MQADINSGVGGQKFNHSHTCPHHATRFNPLRRFNGKAALAEKWLGGEADIGKQPGDARAARRLVKMRHQRLCYAAPPPISAIKGLLLRRLCLMRLTVLALHPELQLFGDVVAVCQFICGAIEVRRARQIRRRGKGTNLQFLYRFT